MPVENETTALTVRELSRDSALNSSELPTPLALFIEGQRPERGISSTIDNTRLIVEEIKLWRVTCL